MSTSEVQQLLMSDLPLQRHVDALHWCRDRYLRQLRLFVANKVILAVSTSTKAKVIAALSIRQEKDTLHWLLTFPRCPPTSGQLGHFPRILFFELQHSPISGCLHG